LIFKDSLDGINHFISGSKDSIIKVWDIDSKYCVENIVSHRGEIWSLAVHGSTLVTGASDGELRVWSVDYPTLAKKFTGDTEMNASNPQIKKAIELVGTLERQNKDKIALIKFNPTFEYLGVQVHYIFLVNTLKGIR
jgi:U3 small nucleolar RNA-associated protein 12